MQAKPLASDAELRLAQQVAGLRQVTLHGVALHALTQTCCVELVYQALVAGVGGWIVTVNLHHLKLFADLPSYAALCAGATLRVADGMPLVWASRMQGTPLPERIAGVDLLGSLSAAAARDGRRIFLLGGDPGTAEATAQQLQRQHSSLQIAGTACPARGFFRRPAEVEELVARLRAAAPDVVYVALGKPVQDELIAVLRSQLPHAWFVGVGISFSFHAGKVHRAPRWLQATGFEWLHRIAQEPSRLTGRYIGMLPVAASLFASALVRRVRNARRSSRALSNEKTGDG
jgi:N-acetylglucosaminyldiphosphoundecaprenol N-acetyl-beta-D-mannosaminyltransferase